MQIWDFNEAGFFERLETFIAERTQSADVSTTVAGILAAVRERGDAAVCELTERFDGAQMQPGKLRVRAEAIARARREVAESDLAAMRAAVAQVQTFHQRTLPENWTMENGHGGRVGERFYPLRRVGIYIPGGGVPLVSTVVMTTVLAKMAGVPEVVVTTPPRPDGLPAPAILAALDLCGVDEVYAVGGAQAVGALAYGTESLRPVDKVFGPGNAFVNEAKRQVFGTVGVDLLPGPSEVCIIADVSARPEWVAADLLAQAEHGSGKELVYLVAPSRDFVAEGGAAARSQRAQPSHAEAIAKVLDKGALAIVTDSLEGAAEGANAIAPEHLELQIAEAQLPAMQERITTAGAMLLGHHTPTVLGDFVAGPSHTLPTGRAGRFHSGLQAIDFMRRTSTVHYTAAASAQAAPTVRAFANMESLDAHGQSLEIRLAPPSER